MGRARRRKQTSRNAGGASAEGTPSPPIWKRGTKTIGFIVAAIGLISAVISFQSNVTITPGEAVQQDDVSTIPFEITNNSPYSIYWVRHSCEIYSAIFPGDRRIDDVRSFPAVQRQERLDSGQGRTIFCPILGKDDPKAMAADLGIRVIFRPFYLPVERTVEGRFQIAADPSGRLRVLRRNVSDDYTLQ